ncbi:DUF4175 domain-containing protein [Sphingomonas corticis]|uniref:DUF4175 domain-containing protein n=1 Tax=Sphingomonas corticis TaxID=2722791 RepID=A0ABX1CLP6_9SPHN|nr:DUF4175 domain-containing protein [Sphingomonas corticis]NJR78899.1 DUF4175 domain-containing protein [Sphingomonas corticis]
MSAPDRAARWTRPAKRRAGVATLVIGAPLAAATALWSLPLAIVLLAATAVAAWRRARRFDRRWLVRRLDARHAAAQDSADLLFADPATLGPLQRLQLARVSQGIAEEATDLADPWPVGRIAAAWLAAGALVAAILLWPAAREEPLAPSDEGVARVPGVPALTGQRLRVVPPAYTGLPARDLATLDARVPAGSRIEWTLAFDPAPAAAALAFLDGRRVVLAPGARWRGATTLVRSGLYRVAPAGAPAGRLHRIDAVADQPPRVVVRAPRETLTLATPGQRGWTVAFEARDDYGVAAAARLVVTTASGEGEQVTFRERTLALSGSGAATARRFATTLDLPAMGLTGAGDLIAQLVVTDGARHVVRGPSLILRRKPPQSDLGTGLDVGVRVALPAYLTSQRQVIIDAQALLRERRRLSPAAFLARAQRIGDDQGALRMRYGNFLGGETEGASNAMPTSDAEAPAADVHSPDDGHDHGPAGTPLVGRAEDVLGEFGHAHDEGEAATLFDPETHARLTEAVDQMWQSEGALRGGDPARALPFANRALVLIKQVQQATRVFLAKVGSELPPIDAARRMTGKRDDIAPTMLALPARDGDEAAAARAWAAVDGVGRGDTAALDRFLAGAAVRDPLALAAARDAVRRDPACAACRARLRGLVWEALSRPPAGAARRAGASAAGRRYLDAIGGAR